MDKEKQLREQLVKLLQGGQAYAVLNDIVQDLTVKEAGKRVQQLPYTIWQLLEHLRFALHDIVDFSCNPNYVQPEWPQDYWTDEEAPADKAALKTCLKAIEKDMQDMIYLIQNPANNLYEPFAHGDGQNLMREAMLIAEHNAYHLGQVVVLRRLLGHWEH